jgi:hypothetical protein
MTDSAGLIVRTSDGVAIQQCRADGHINATAMCRACGRQLGHYLANQSTGAAHAALARSIGIRMDRLLEIRATVPNAERATWAHPRVAIRLAMWLARVGTTPAICVRPGARKGRKTT